MKKVANKIDKSIHSFTLGILIPIILIAAFFAVGFIDGGAEAGNFPVTRHATIRTVVILDDGNEYIVSEKDTNVTVNTYGSNDPERWDICKY